MDNKDIPKSQESIDDGTYGAKDYAKKVFSFSQQELAELKPLEDATTFVGTLMTLATIAQRAKDNYVGGQVLKRLGIKESQDTKFNYDLTNKRIIVYEPRLWCSQCDAKKAEYKYEDKIYCRDCIEEKKKFVGKPIEKPTQDKKPEAKV